MRKVSFNISIITSILCLSISFPLGESRIIGNFIFKCFSTSNKHANLKAKTVLCRMAPDNSFKLDVNKYFSEIESPSNPNSMRYFFVL